MDAPAPTVSVIIATYNWSSALRLAIESALQQTLHNFELLVVGDACTDDSAEVAASFGDPRIRWHNLPGNSGNQSGPNNAGIKMARGRYIAYLGHDDIWLPDHLERHVETMEKTGADVTYSWLEMIGPEPVTLRQIAGIHAGEEYDGGTVLPPSALMHRSDIVAKVGLWKDYRKITRPTDQEFVARIFQAGKKFAPVGRLTALKFNAAWRPHCYVEKPVGQQTDALRRIRENPAFLCDELHSLVEMLVRKHPAELIPLLAPPANSRPGEIVEHTRRLRGVEPKALGEAQPPADFPPLGEVVDLTKPEADPYLWTGWSWLEPRFRWTDGKEARVIFSLDKQVRLRARVLAAPFLIPGKLSAQNVAVSCNGKEMAQWRLEKNVLEIQEFFIDRRCLKTNNVLIFHLPDAAMPMSFGDSLDARQLGLRVGWIEFERWG